MAVSFDPEETKCHFEPAKELEFVQERIEPTIGDAIVHIEGVRVVQLMMQRLQDEPLTLQPASKRGGTLLMRPFMKLVSGDGGRRHQRERDYGKRQ